MKLLNSLSFEYPWFNRLKMKTKDRKPAAGSALSSLVLVILSMVLIPMLKCQEMHHGHECPLETIVEIEQSFDDLLIVLADLKDARESKFMLRADKDPLTAKIRDKTSGKDVSALCQKLVWSLSRVSHDLECSILDHVRLDSVSLPQMLVLAKSAASSTCENGLYEFKIAAREKKTGSQTGASIFIEIRDGLASLSNHRQVTETENQDGQAYASISQSPGQPINFGQNDSEADYGHDLDVIGEGPIQTSQKDDGEENASLRDNARKLPVNDQYCAADDEHYEIHYSPGNLNGNNENIYKSSANTYLMNSNGSPVNLIFKERWTSNVITVDPSCLDLEWRMSGAINQILEMDDPLSPTCIKIPQRSIGTMWGQSVQVNLYNNGQAINTNWNTFGFSITSMNGSDPNPLSCTSEAVCARSQSSTASVSYEIFGSTSIQIDPFVAADSGCDITSVTCSQAQHTSVINLCSLTNSAYDSDSSFEFGSFDPATLTFSSADYPVTFVITMGVTSEDDTADDFTYTVTLTENIVCVRSQSSPASASVSYETFQSTSLQIDTFQAADSACTLSGITCTQPIHASGIDLCSPSYGAFDGIDSWQFNSFNPASLGILQADYPVTFVLTMGVTSVEDGTEQDFTYTIELTRNIVCARSQSSAASVSYETFQSSSIQISPFIALESVSECQISSVTCTQASGASGIDLCTATYSAFDAPGNWQFHSFDPASLSISSADYPVTFVLTMRVISNDSTYSDFSYTVELTENIVCARSQTSSASISYETFSSSSIQISPFTAIESVSECQISSITCTQASSASGIDLCTATYSAFDAPGNWQFHSFDPASLNIPSADYPVTFALTMRVTSNDSTYNDFSYTVELTENIVCARSQSSAPTVSYDIFQFSSLEIAPFQALDSECTISDISCTQVTPATRLDLCQYFGSYDSSTNQWKFQSFDPNNLGIDSYPITFDLTMRVTSMDQTFDDYPYTVTLTNSIDPLTTPDSPSAAECSDSVLNSILAPADLTMDYILGSGQKFLKYPKFTTTLDGCKYHLQKAIIKSYDPQFISLDDESRDFWIETNNQTFNGSQTQLSFETSLTDYPSVTVTAYVYINILHESKTSSILNKMPPPYFDKIKSKIKQPFIFDLDDQNHATEVDFGALIVPNRFGENKVIVQLDSRAAGFLQIRKIQNSYKLVIINEQVAKPGTYTLKVIISNANGRSPDDENQKIEVPVLVIKRDIINVDFDQPIDSSDQELTDSSSSTQILTKEEQEYNIKIEKPSLKDNKISLTGSLQIDFTKLRFREEPKVIARRQLESIEEELRDISELVYGTPEEDWKIKGVIIWIEPSEISDPEMLKFTYSATEFDEEILRLQINFENPEYVSQLPLEQDYLVIELKEFRDEDGQLISDLHLIRQPLPTQMEPNSTEQEAVQAVGAVLVTTVVAAISVTFILSFLMAASMNSLFSVIKNMQIISHLPLLSLYVPANAQFLIAFIFKAISFDYFNMIPLIQIIFRLEHKNDVIEMEDKMVQIGYVSGYMLESLGTLLFVLLTQIIYVILLLIMTVLGNQKTKKWARTSIDAMIFNPVLTVIDGIFLIIVMNSAINIQKVSEGLVYMNTSFYASIFGLVFCLSVVFFTAVFLIRNKASLDQKEKKKRCGYVYQQLKHQVNANGFMGLIYPTVYQLRFVVLAYTILYLHKYKYIQYVIVFVYTTFVFSILANMHPFSERSKNNWEIISEVMIIFVLDLLILCSTLMIDPEAKKSFGITLVSVVGLIMFIGLGKVMINNYYLSKLYYKKKCTKNIVKAEETKDQMKIELKVKNLSNLENHIHAEQPENYQDFVAIEAKIQVIDVTKDVTPVHFQTLKDLGLSSNEIVELAINKQWVVHTSEGTPTSDKEQDPRASKLIQPSNQGGQTQSCAGCRVMKTKCSSCMLDEIKQSVQLDQIKEESEDQEASERKLGVQTKSKNQEQQEFKNSSLEDKNNDAAVLDLSLDSLDDAFSPVVYQVSITDLQGVNDDDIEAKYTLE